MKKAFVFPGQGSQFVGMAKDILDNHPEYNTYFEKANKILGFDIQKIMFDGPEGELLQTSVTQPAIFIHSFLAFLNEEDKLAQAVAGHSLGEYSALVASGVLSFEDGLKLVSVRANAMQKACDAQKSSMAAIIGLSNEDVESLCGETEELVVPANYNSNGQVVISGTEKGIDDIVTIAKDKGARMAIKLKVNGAFHSPLMQSAEEELEEYIMKVDFKEPFCPIYQNVNAQPVTNPGEIKLNLIKQLTSSVKWTQTVLKMKENGIEEFKELGPGKVLSGLIRKIK